MYSCNVSIGHEEGLKLKVAGDFSQLAKKFKSSIVVSYNNQEADGKSLLELLSLAINYDSVIRISADGPDEKDAVTSLALIAQNKFD